MTVKDKTTEDTTAGMEIAKLKKQVKRYEAQLKDLNRELHDINKWRLAVEDKIGAIEV